MKGIDFYKSLQKKYSNDGENIYRNYYFNSWLKKNNAAKSLQFKLKSNVKAIPKEWIIDSQNAKNKGEIIDRNWFNRKYNKKNYNDCRASVLMWLLENHKQ